MAQPRNFLSGYNDFVKQMSSFGNPNASFFKSPLGQLSGAASKTGQINAVAQFAQKPTLGTGIKGAATYALNANPYYAGLNALTGGALDRGVGSAITSIGRTLGLSRRPPAQNTQLATQQADYQRQINERGNELMKAYGRYRREEDEAERQAEAYRTSGLNLAREGLSARDMAGPMAMLMNPAFEARDAALANTQADLARRGISSGGIAAGARAGIEGATAAGAAAARGLLAQQAAERAQSMQDTTMAADTARADRASRLGLSALGSAADTATQLQELQLRQRAQEAAIAAQRRAERNAAMQGIGNFIGTYGEDLLKLLRGGGSSGPLKPAVESIEARGSVASPDRFNLEANTRSANIFNRELLSGEDLGTLPRYLGLGPSAPDRSPDLLVGPRNTPLLGDPRTGGYNDPVSVQTDQILNMMYPFAQLGESVEYNGQIFQKGIGGQWLQSGSLAPMFSPSSGGGYGFGF